MSGLYIVADLSALRAAADQIAGAVDSDADGPPPSFGSPDADEAMHEFGTAARDHATRMSAAAQQAAQALHGYAVTFHEIGD